MKNNPARKNIKIDFAKNKSLGNSYDETVVDNFKLFEEAEILYSRNKTKLEHSIDDAIELLAGPKTGGEITIPTVSYQSPGFIKKLIFGIDEINDNECKVSLKKITIL
jgi:hypothetical protein